MLGLAAPSVRSRLAESMRSEAMVCFSLFFVSFRLAGFPSVLLRVLCTNTSSAAPSPCPSPSEKSVSATCSTSVLPRAPSAPSSRPSPRLLPSSARTRLPSTPSGLLASRASPNSSSPKRSPASKARCQHAAIDPVHNLSYSVRPASVLG